MKSLGDRGPGDVEEMKCEKRKESSKKMEKKKQKKKNKKRKKEKNNKKKNRKKKKKKKKKIIVLAVNVRQFCHQTSQATEALWSCAESHSSDLVQNQKTIIEVE